MSLLLPHACQWWLEVSCFVSVNDTAAMLLITCYVAYPWQRSAGGKDIIMIIAAL